MSFKNQNTKKMKW